MPLSSFTDQFFVAVTWLGSLDFLLPCTAGLVFFLCRSNRKNEALLLGGSLALSSLSTHALKLVFKRPRPDIDILLVPMPPDWSFPSAHAAQATAFFLALALLGARNLPQPAAGLTVAAGILATLTIAYSRVYLQVHHVSDVLAGALAGGLTVLVVAAAIKQCPSSNL